jgi:membrane carboxypeptidase/penicillin-binding protein
MPGSSRRTNSPLHPAARARRDAVLDRMAGNRFITAREAALAKAEPLRVRAGTTPGVEGLFFLQQVRREVQDRLGENAVEDGRLDVYTTMDPFLQDRAESRLRRSLRGLERSHRWLRGGKSPLEGAFVLLDPRDGAVRVLAGGRDFARRPFDRAVRARRQAGSTFKPFVYLAAFQTRPRTMTASMLLDDTPLSIPSGGRIWRPVNYDERFRGRVTVRTALENSLNVPTVRLSQWAGVDAVAREAEAAGWPGDLPRVPALALGVAETSLLDLAGASRSSPGGCRWATLLRA